MLKNPLAIASLFIILIGLTGIYSELSFWRDYLNGTQVSAHVIKKPRSCDAINSRTTYIRLRYGDLVVPKKIGRKYCSELEKRSLDVILSPDEKSLFFLDEIHSFGSEIAASFLLVLVGLGCFSSREKKKHRV